MKVQWDIKILIWVSNYKNVIKINDFSIIKAIQPSQDNLKPEKGKLDCNYISFRISLTLQKAVSCVFRS